MKKCLLAALLVAVFSTPAHALSEPVTGMELVAVKGGCFRMGDFSGVGERDERPLHEVCLDDFLLGRYEVTQAQWQAVMGTNPSSFQECGPACPVEQVSWEDVQAFITALNAKSGKKYRLPSEAEWEYAARSGGRQELFSGGADADAVAWYEANAEEQTHPVGQKKGNGLGIHDMSGNVWEWVADCKGDAYYGESPRSNPPGPLCSDVRVQRGGSWSSTDLKTRTTYRGAYAADYGSWSFGFRLAASVEPVSPAAPTPLSAASVPAPVPTELRVPVAAPTPR